MFSTTRRVVVSSAAAAVGAALMVGGTFLLSGAGSSPADASAPGASFAERFIGEAPSVNCPTSGWPYFEAQCLRMPDGSRARAVRVISVDRLPTGDRMVALAK